MANITITVNRVPNTTDIYLTDSEGHGVGAQRDNITTEVQSGDTVTWAVGSGITSIEGIQSKDSTNFFSTAPSAANRWTGTIKSGLSANDEEAYKIGYKVDNDRTTYWDDPRLKVKV